jgi:hypothetical protein
VIRYGFFAPPKRLENVAPSVQRVWIVMAQCQRPSGIGKPFRRLARFEVGPGAEDIIVGVFRVQLDGAGAIGDGAAGLALVAIGDAAVAIGRFIVRVQLDGAAQSKVGPMDGFTRARRSRWRLTTSRLPAALSSPGLSLTACS